MCDPGYNFGSGSFSVKSGHFTQVVWKESTELGIGRAEVEHDGEKCAYIVARYKPPWNKLKEFAQNVVEGGIDNGYCANISNSGRKKEVLGKAGANSGHHLKDGFSARLECEQWVSCNSEAAS